METKELCSLEELDTMGLVDWLRRSVKNLGYHQIAEAADLIEKQAARIVELEAEVKRLEEFEPPGHL